LNAVGNQTRLTRYVETRTGQATSTLPLTKRTYVGVVCVVYVSREDETAGVMAETIRPQLKQARYK
jgi:hypothetical protein